MPSALLPVAVGPRIATSRGTSVGARADECQRHQRRDHRQHAQHLHPGRHRHGAPGFSLKKKVTVKKALSSGYSGGSGTVGLEARIAFRADNVNASIGDGFATVTSVMRPSLWTLNVTTTCPCMVIAAIGMNQLRRTCATNRAIQGPNSTPLESKLMAGPKSWVWPLRFTKPSLLAYFCTFRMASASTPLDPLRCCGCGSGDRWYPFGDSGTGIGGACAVAGAAGSPAAGGAGLGSGARS